MNWFDLVLIGIIVLYLINGFTGGMIKQLISVFGFIIVLALSFFGSRLLSGYVANLLSPDSLMPYQEVAQRIGVDLTAERVIELVAAVLTFLALFMVLQIVFRLITGKLQSINRIPVVGLINRVGGAVIGLVLGVLFVYVAITVFSLVPIEFIDSAMGGSAVVSFTGKHLPALTANLQQFLAKFFVNTVNGGA